MTRLATGMLSAFFLASGMALVGMSLTMDVREVTLEVVPSRRPLTVERGGERLHAVVHPTVVGRAVRDALAAARN